MSTGPSVLTPSSWRPDAPLNVDDLGDSSARFFAQLSSEGRAPAHVRIYATAATADAAVAAVMATAPSEPVVSVVTANPCSGGDIAGLHVLSAPADQPIETIRDGEEVVGVKVGGGSPIIVLAGLTTPQDGVADDEFTVLFRRAESLLTPHGLSFTDVARTWLHLPKLLRDYDALNRARSAFFATRGIGRDIAPPASTGIQGGTRDGGRMQMDLVATAPEGFRPVVANLQCEAWEYGSAFSRGMTLGDDLVTVSGTASIDANGRTIHVDDAIEQIRATWATVGQLLSAEDLSLPPSGPQAWVLYFKDPSVWAAWRELVAAGEVQEPAEAVCVYADVCRDDLLFEMELTAGR